MQSPFTLINHDSGARGSRIQLTSVQRVMLTAHWSPYICNPFHRSPFPQSSLPTGTLRKPMVYGCLRTHMRLCVHMHKILDLVSWYEKTQLLWHRGGRGLGGGLWVGVSVTGHTWPVPQVSTIISSDIIYVTVSYHVSIVWSYFTITRWSRHATLIC